MVGIRTTITTVAIGAAVGLLTVGCSAAQPNAQPARAALTSSSPAPISSELATPTDTSASSGSAAPVSTTVASAAPGLAADPAPPTLISAPADPLTPRTDRCDSTVLSAKVQDLDAGAGQRYAKFVVTNLGVVPCTLYGHGGFALVGTNGHPVPTSLKWVDGPGPSLVTLAPHSAAAMNLHWSVVPDGTEPTSGPCEDSPTGVNSIPPDETQPVHASWTFGQVCDQGGVEASAFYPV